ncbi:F0F1 ATP synthase subunit B [Pannus brasiliensis CCIBt3594]|uniref:ATP synthase subunit b n=1 Tax=Pannus brasiliensis CCIBt3594 TaxID=1427578 RepID=A0AAW9QXH5_9CHRO
MLDNILFLATEAHEAAEGGFGLNFNILETNLFNLAILLGLIVFYGRKVLGNILGDRRAKIAEALAEVEGRKNKAAAALAEEQKKLAEAKAEAGRIVSTANQRARVIADEIAKKADLDIAKMQEAATKDLSAEQERVLADLRKRIAELAIANVESRLAGGLEGSTQQTLIDRALANLGGK